MNSRSPNTKRTWLGWVHDFLARTGLAQHDPEASLTAQQLACIFLGVAVTSCLAACVAYKQLEVQLELAKSPGKRGRRQATSAQEAAALGVCPTNSPSPASLDVLAFPSSTAAAATQRRSDTQHLVPIHPQSHRQLDSAQLQSAVTQDSRQSVSRRMRHDEAFHDASDQVFYDSRPASTADTQINSAPLRGRVDHMPGPQFSGELLQDRQLQPPAIPLLSAVAMPDASGTASEIPPDHAYSGRNLLPGQGQALANWPHAQQQMRSSQAGSFPARRSSPSSQPNHQLLSPQEQQAQRFRDILSDADDLQQAVGRARSPMGYAVSPVGRAASPDLSEYAQQQNAQLSRPGQRMSSPGRGPSPPPLSRRAWLYTSLPPQSAEAGASRHASSHVQQQLSRTSLPCMMRPLSGEAAGGVEPWSRGSPIQQQQWQARVGQTRGLPGAVSLGYPQQSSAAATGAVGVHALHEGHQPLWPPAHPPSRHLSPGPAIRPLSWAQEQPGPGQHQAPLPAQFHPRQRAVPYAGADMGHANPSGLRSPSPSPRTSLPQGTSMPVGHHSNAAPQQQAPRSALASPGAQHSLHAAPGPQSSEVLSSFADAGSFHMQPHMTRTPSPSVGPSPGPRSPGLSSSPPGAYQVATHGQVPRSATPSPPSSRPSSPGGPLVLAGTTFLNTHPHGGSRSPSPSPQPSPTHQGRPPLPLHTRQRLSRSQSPSPRPASPGPMPAIAEGTLQPQQQQQQQGPRFSRPFPQQPSSVLASSRDMAQTGSSLIRHSAAAQQSAQAVMAPQQARLDVPVAQPHLALPLQQQQQQQPQKGASGLPDGMLVRRVGSADARLVPSTPAAMTFDRRRSSPEGSPSGTGTGTGTPVMTSTEEDSTPGLTSPSTSRTPSTLPRSGPTSRDTSDGGEPWSTLGDGHKRLSGNRILTTNQKRRGSEGSEGPLPSRPALHAGVADGEQSYQWADGGEYFGEWRDGHPHGRGTYVSPDGDEYEGEWRYGRESGAGTWTKPDGARSYGFWLRGQRHGEVIYTPASVDNRRAEVLYLQRWEKNEMKEECVLRVAEDDIRRKQQKKLKKLERKSHAKEGGSTEVQQARDGETIYKGHRSYELMRDLQRGITFSIARAGREAAAFSNPPPEDFTKIVTQQFPRMAEQKSFKWKDYCPGIFARLRETFGIDTRDYLLSLTGDRALRELPSPGKSGSVFFMSDDDRFLIKTVRKEEMHLLLLLIPKYYRHCQKHPDTLLTRFYGVHRVKPILGGTVRFVVMGNCLPTDVRLHRKYDLKGSTYGRTAGMKAQNPNAILKDLDMDLRLQLDPVTHRAMMHQIDADVAVLEQLHVMDYSLLLGVHYSSWGDDQWQPPSAHQAYKTKGVNLNPLAPLVRNIVGTDPKHILSGKARLNKGQDVKAVYGNQFEQDGSFRRSGDEGGNSEEDEPMILTGDHHSEREPAALQGAQAEPRRSRFPPVLPRLSSDSEASRHSQNPIMSTPQSRDADAHPEFTTPSPHSPHALQSTLDDSPDQAGIHSTAATTASSPQGLTEISPQGSHVQQEGAGLPIRPARPLPASHNKIHGPADFPQTDAVQQDSRRPSSQLQRTSTSNRFASCFGSLGTMQVLGQDAPHVSQRAYRTEPADQLSAAAAAAAAASPPPTQWRSPQGSNVQQQNVSFPTHPARPLPAIHSGEYGPADLPHMDAVPQQDSRIAEQSRSSSQLQRTSTTNRFASCFGSFPGMQMATQDAPDYPARAYRTESADKLSAAAAAAAASPPPSIGKKASRFFKSLRPRLSMETPSSAFLGSPPHSRGIMTSPSAFNSQPARIRGGATTPSSLVDGLPAGDRRAATSPTPFISRPGSGASSSGTSPVGTAAAPTSPTPANPDPSISPQSVSPTDSSSRSSTANMPRRSAAGTPPALHTPIPASAFSSSPPVVLDSGAMPMAPLLADAGGGVPGSGPSQNGLVPGQQVRRGGMRSSSEPGMAMVGVPKTGRLPAARPGSTDLNGLPSDGPRMGPRQVAFQEDSSSAARQELTAELELQQLSRTRGAVGSHSFTATAADPRLRQRHRAREAPRRSTSMLPNHFQGMAIRRKDLLQDTARDSGDDSPLGRRSSRRLGSLHSADQARLGSATPAMAVSQPQRGSASPLAKGPPGGERVMLYFGIIDFLQEYNFRKRMEHAMKRTVVDGKTISVVDPRQYAKRFRRSMKETFVSKG